MNIWLRLLQEFEPRMRKAFLDAVRNMRDRAHLDAIEQSLKAGDIEGAVEAVGLTGKALRPFDQAIAQAFEAGGDQTVKRLKPKGGLAIIFDVRNPAAESILRDYSGQRIREITADQRTVIRETLTAGLRAGVNPKQAALDLVGRVSRITGKREGGIIGLTSTQGKWVRRYGEELADPDIMPNALTRKLRDKRYDPAVRKAMDAGLPVDPDKRVRMLTAYKNRALRLRAETIARTETMSAMNSAQEEAVKQAIADKEIPPGSVTYIWRSAHDARVRDTHMAMDGQRRSNGEKFVSPSGARLRFPGDPEAPADERIGCRCIRVVDVDFLAGVT